MRKCGLEFCGKDANGSRGLCRTHYNWVKTRVDRDEYAWGDLEKLGITIPPRADVQSKTKKQFEALVAKRTDGFGK